MSCVRRPYFKDGRETIHFSQRGQIEFDLRSVNHRLTIKEKERDNGWVGVVWRTGNRIGEQVGKKWKKTTKKCEKDNNDNIILCRERR